MSAVPHRVTMPRLILFMLLLCSGVVWPAGAFAQDFGVGYFEFDDSWRSSDVDDSAHVQHATFRGASEEVMNAAIRSSKELRSVTFVDCAPNGSVLEALAGHAKSLVSFAIYGEALDVDPDAIAWMNKLESLKTIAIPRGIWLEDEENENFADEHRLLWNLSPERLDDTEGTLLSQVSVWNLRHYRGWVSSLSLVWLIDARNLEVIESTSYHSTSETIHVLSRLTSVRELRLRNWQTWLPFASDDLALLSNLSALEVLEIDELPGDFDVLAAALSELPSLRELILVDMIQVATGLKGLRALATSKSLTTVSIRNCSISEEGVAALVKGSAITQLEVLNWPREGYSDGLSYSLLADLGSLARLESLNVNVTPDEGESASIEWGESVIRAISKNTHLRELVNLSLSVGPDALSALRNLQALEVLDLTHVEETEASGMRFLQGLPKLHTLTLSASHITEDMGQVLSKCSQLRSLTVRWWSLGNLSYLTRALEALDRRQLVEFEFDASDQTLPAAEFDRFLQSVARQERLEKLVLHHTVTCEQLLLLKGATNLTHLDMLTTLSDSQPDLARNLASLPALKSVIVRFWSMTLEDAAILAESESIVHVSAGIKAIVNKELLRLCSKHPTIIFQHKEM